MFFRLSFAVAAVVVLSACSTVPSMAPKASLVSATQTTPALEDLPPPTQPVYVAVYKFPDLTGQAKPNPNFAEYSRAVTQGADAILVDVLTSLAGGSWFHVVERSGLQNLVQERTLIENTRRAYGGGSNLPPVRFAGLLLEGGIVGYDSDYVTGGLGAAYFGIGGDTEYRADLVTINLRAVSVETGEVLASVTTTKQIYSFKGRFTTYNYVAPLRLLEIDAGKSANDPGQLAVREGIELAVYALIAEGLEKKLWTLRNPAMTKQILDTFKQTYDPPEVDKLVADAG